jgi:hypothetical protein
MSDEELREWIRAQMGKGLSGPQIANLLERCTPDPCAQNLNCLC